MAAPTATARGTPAGIQLCDGMFSVITFARLPTVSFWEKGVTPPGLEGGDAIDATSHHNVRYRTKCPRSLIDLTDVTTKVFYDPNVYNQIITDLINVPDTVTVEFHDGSTLAFYGYLKSFVPDEMTEGTKPEATITIVCTNFDHANDVEAGPVLTSVAGT